MRKGFLSEDDLRKGAWYALEQAGNLMDSAVLLYDAGQYSTAVGVAMLAREEFGRSTILRDFAQDAANRAVSVVEVRTKCNKHDEKQAKGMWSHVFKPPRESKLGRAIIAQMEEPISSAKAEAARQFIDREVQTQRRDLPRKRHQKRMQAFYVDVEDSGEWTRPASISAEEARELVEHAVNDYSVKYHNLSQDSHAPEMTAVRKHMAPAPELRPPRWPKRS